MQESPKTTDSAEGDGDTLSRVVRVVTGSRLHFGLLDTAAPFGGVGVMIDAPTTEIVLRPSECFRCAGHDADRVESIVSRAAKACDRSRLPDCEVTVVGRPPAHCGLGSGTQLALALAESSVWWHDCSFTEEQIVMEVAGRGKRSAVGSHGYFHGGLIFEEATEDSELNVVRERIELPDSWRVAVLRPALSSAPVSGDLESRQFDRLSPASETARDALRKTVKNEMLPAAREGSFLDFTDAVHRYNRASGELFAEAQGGAYNGPHVTDLVNWLVKNGAHGVGQSSWGPGAFAWFETEDCWLSFRRRMTSDVVTVVVTSVRNQGRDFSRGSSHD